MMAEIAIVLIVFLAGYWFRGQQELVQWRYDSTSHKLYKKARRPDTKKVETKPEPEPEVPKAKPMTGTRFSDITKSSNSGKG